MARTALGGVDAVRTTPSGWVLRSDAVIVDAHRFEGHVDDGRRAAACGRLDDAVRTFDIALALWRGEVAQGAGPSIGETPGAVRLRELRLSVLEDRFDAELARGRHHEVLLALEASGREHPQRRRLCAQRMVALYRAGRQVEALLTFRAFRLELGTEPDADLLRLEHDIRTHSTGLDWSPPATEWRTDERPWVPDVPWTLGAARRHGLSSGAPRPGA